MTDIDDRRFRVREALTKHFGDEFARDFMSITPTINWSDVATKSDLDALETRVDRRFAEMKGEMDHRFAEMKGDMDRRFAEMKGEMHSLVRSQTIALTAILGGLMTVMTTALSLVAFFA